MAPKCKITKDLNSQHPVLGNGQVRPVEIKHEPWLTYGPHKAVAEVSNHNEPIGKKSGSHLVRKSMDFTFNCFVLN